MDVSHGGYPQLFEPYERTVQRIESRMEFLLLRFQTLTVAVDCAWITFTAR